LPLIVSYLLGRVDAFARDGRAKKNNRIFRYAAPSQPPPLPRRMYNMFPLYILLPGTLDSFPTRMFSVHRHYYLLRRTLYSHAICVCVLYYLYMYKNYMIVIVLGVINVIIWQPSRDRQKKRDEVSLHILYYNIIIACVGLHYACTHIVQYSDKNNKK